MHTIQFTILTLLLMVGLGACQGDKTGAETPTETTQTHAPEKEESGSQEPHREQTVELTAAQWKTAGVVTGPLEQKNLGDALRVSGRLDVPPQSLASVSTPLGGFVRSTEMLPGSQVRKGQVIARVENPEFIRLQQEYLENASQLTFLELEFARQQDLFGDDVASAKTFQQVRADYLAAQARVSGLSHRLEMLGIKPGKLTAATMARTIAVYAPISGYVTQVNVNLGKYVQPTDVLFSIANTEHLHVELTVFEKDVLRLRKGQKVRFSLPNESGRERSATLYLIGREIGPDRSVQVHAHMDQEDTELLPGIFVNALIETGRSGVAALPNEAIVQSQGKDFVFVVAGKRQENGEAMYDYRMVEVGRGVTEGNNTAVTFPDETPAQESQFVVKGAYALLAKKENGEEEGHGH